MYNRSQSLTRIINLNLAPFLITQLLELRTTLTRITEPISDLLFRVTSDVHQLSFFFASWIWVVQIVHQPVIQRINIYQRLSPFEFGFHDFFLMNRFHWSLFGFQDWSRL